MTIPNDKQCREILDEMSDFTDLNDFETQFVESNTGRTSFTPRQREVIAGFTQKYDFKCYQ